MIILTHIAIQLNWSETLSRYDTGHVKPLRQYPKYCVSPAEGVIAYVYNYMCIILKLNK